tara:strand:- start:450 stop:791 length:342 start_codon:yes stop_codon:yes gene_type:complete
MKTVINCTKIKSSKNFENNILKLLPKDMEEDIYIDCIGMRRNRGLGGAYENYLEIFIGRFNRLSFTDSHNDSVGWDEYQDWDVDGKKYQDWAKSTVLYLLEENKDKITEHNKE